MTRARFAATAGLGGFAILAAGFGIGATAGGDPPPGDEKTLETRTLELGARVLQGTTPAEELDIHLVGFHPLKDEPSHQMEAHHFCEQVNEDFAQCVLFDGDGSQARLHGIEYIISEKLFETLPEGERAYWHPHNYEILSGQLVAPGVPEVAEKRLMRGKMNSYGKTWHVWSTGVFERKDDALPLGEPRLGWSFNRDGEAHAGMLAARDESLGTNTAEIREARRELAPLAEPQEGVDAIAGSFADANGAPDGVQAKARRDP
jgi:hypothetical protein